MSDPQNPQPAFSDPGPPPPLPPTSGAPGPARDDAQGADPLGPAQPQVPWYAVPQQSPAHPTQPQVPPYAATAPYPQYAAQPQVPPYGATTAYPQYAAPYTLPQHPQYAAAIAPPAPVAGDRTLGLVALVLALVAVVVTPIVAAIAGFDTGLGVGKEIAARPSAAAWDWSILSPVRDSVLLGEISFWAGTVLGIWAIVQGIISIVRRRGRGLGIAAVVVAVLAPSVFFFAGYIAVIFGAAAGAGTGG